MLIETRAVAPFFKNGFVVADDEVRQGVVIDPGDEVDQLLDVVKAGRLTITHILLTHAHVDHVTGVARAKAAFGVPVLLHPDDRFLYDMAAQQGAMFGLTVEQLPPPDGGYDRPIAVGRYVITAHHTPGHSPGGVCLKLAVREQGGRSATAPHLFVGDTLFAGSIGRTDLPGGNYNTLIASIKSVLYGFGDDAVVHPGHGPATTIGEERRGNPFLVA